MTKSLENQIEALKKELADVQKEIANLRLQPCKGDSEIAKKDAKFDELDRKGATLRKIIVDLTRKLQLSMAQSNREASCVFPSSSDSS